MSARPQNLLPAPGGVVDPGTAQAGVVAWARTHRKITAERRAVTGGVPSYPMAVTLKGEPRIQYVARLLASLLRLGRFTVGGQPVDVDGFQLRNMAHWTEDRPATPEEIFELLSQRCEVKCEFCYLRMDPDHTVTKFNPNRTEEIAKDIDLRIDLMAQGKRLFAPTFQLEEIIGNPHFERVTSRLRGLSEAVMCFNTTGAALTEQKLDYLQTIEPVEVRVSLNSADPAERFRIMRDKKHQVLDALRSLRRRNMRFSVSIVMWPNLTWHDIEQTIRFADECQPYGIICILPGYTDAFSPEPLFDSEHYWTKTVRRVAALRGEIGTPLIVHPRLFEESAMGYPPNLPLVIGVTPRSAAARAGLRIGDVVSGIDEFNPVLGRRQLDTLLLMKHSQDPDSVRLHVLRGRERLTLELDVRGSYRDGYPYRPPYDDQFGVNLISQGIAISDLRELGRIARAEGARVVAIATSTIVQPSLEHMLKVWGPQVLGDIRCVPFVPRNRFYGGNICLGELCTVSDYVAAIDELVRIRDDIDLVIVPSPAFGPGGWWRDVQGVPFSRIQRACKVPVRMLVCSPFE